MTTTTNIKEKYKSSKSVKVSIRLPNFLYNDLKLICEKYTNLNMSKIIVFATVKDIQRYLQVGAL